MRIRITGPALAVPALGIAPERLSDLIGCRLEANGQAVAMPRKERPDLPAKSDSLYAVAIADILEALALKPDAHPDAIIAWGTLVESCLIYFPASAVSIETN